MQPILFNAYYQEPPILTVSPEKNVDVEVGVEVKLTCLATGR